MTAHSLLCIVGTAGVGKQSLAQALGAQRIPSPAEDSTRRFRWTPTRGVSVDLVVCDDVSSLRDSTDVAVLLLVFDVTSKQSLESLVAMVDDQLRGCASRLVLVGTHADLEEAREVQATDALQLAAPIDFDDSVDVSCKQPPFPGVAYLRQLLLAWLTEPAVEPLQRRVPTAERPDQGRASTPPSPTPLPPSLSPGGRCVRTSIWLYDPTEDSQAPPGPDVKLRPISRALYELRVAGSDRVKLQEKKRDHVVASTIQRSRYHGPTESSRSMRWQAHAQQQELKLRQQRSASKAIHLIETKSFLQATKLSDLRAQELKTRSAFAKGAPPNRATRAMSAPLRNALTPHSARPMARRQPPSQPMPPGSSTQSPFALELLSPGAERVAALPAPVPLQHLQSPLPPVSSPEPTNDGVEQDDGVLWLPEEEEEEEEDGSRSWTNDGEHETASTLPHTDHDDTTAPPELSVTTTTTTDIDDLLDFFDGVTLPLE
ncbi:hypothetical protein PINS_up007381 [Pythium insidiosum]|nr:hypothetical protein PINS_up007381 [Pythium insidiosum]